MQVTDRLCSKKLAALAESQAKSHSTGRRHGREELPQDGFTIFRNFPFVSIWSYQISGGRSRLFTHVALANQHRGIFS